MFRLVSSSDPNAVNSFAVRAHYAQRLVLTTAVCRELRAGTQDDVLSLRAREALALLSWWMRESYDLPRGDVNYWHGLDDPRLTEFAPDFREELFLGTRVCGALFMAYTADKSWELESDIEQIRRELRAYREARGSDDRVSEEP